MYIVIIKFNRLNYFGKKRANWIFYVASSSSTTTVYHEILDFHGIRLLYRSKNIVVVVKFVVKGEEDGGRGAGKFLFIRGDHRSVSVNRVLPATLIRGIER